MGHLDKDRECEAVKVYSLKEFVEQKVRAKPGGPINILSVDVEGFDGDVLVLVDRSLDQPAGGVDVEVVEPEVEEVHLQLTPLHHGPVLRAGGSGRSARLSGRPGAGRPAEPGDQGGADACR